MSWRDNKYFFPVLVEEADTFFSQEQEQNLHSPWKEVKRAMFSPRHHSSTSLLPWSTTQAAKQKLFNTALFLMKAVVLYLIDVRRIGCSWFYKEKLIALIGKEGGQNFMGTVRKHSQISSCLDKATLILSTSFQNMSVVLKFLGQIKGYFWVKWFLIVQRTSTSPVEILNLL